MGRVSKFFSGLVGKLPDSVRVRFVSLTPEEQKFRGLTQKGEKILGSSFDPGRINWQEYKATMLQLRTSLDNYQGKFRRYFENKVARLDYLEKSVCGYDNSF